MDMDISPAGVEMGQTAKKWGGTRNGWIAWYSLPLAKLLRNYQEFMI
jgi:hypothetical protein